MILKNGADIQDVWSGEIRKYLTRAQHNIFIILLLAHWMVQNIEDNSNIVSYRTYDIFLLAIATYSSQQ